MSSYGRDIKAFLTLDVTQFNRGLATARTSATGFKRELEGLKNIGNSINGITKNNGLDNFKKQLNEIQSSFGNILF